MQRFNTTTKGYRFDKVIFWICAIILIITASTQFYIHGTTFKPYFNCIRGDGTNNLGECKNPFYDKAGYGCSYAFGMKECDINKEPWMEKQYLPVGQYGEEPVNSSWFLYFTFGLFLLGLILNHFKWNKGKTFHINILDKIEKLNIGDDK